jgi:hypothetical protein
MAILKNKHLGIISGRIGDSIMRHYGNKVVIAARAIHYHKSNSESSLKNRSDFGFSNAFSTAAAKNPLINQIWKTSMEKNERVHCKLLGLNKGRIYPETSFSDALFVPYEVNMQVEITEYRMETENKLRHFYVKLAPFTQDYYPPGSVVSLQGVLFCSAPFTENKKPFTFLPMASNDMEITSGQPVELKLSVSAGNNYAISTNYRDFKLILTAICRTNLGELIKISSTIETGIMSS